MATCNSSTFLDFSTVTTNGFSGQSLDVAFNLYPYYLGLGLHCADIRPDFDSNSPSWVSGAFLKNGDSFGQPSVGDITFAFPSIPDAPTTSANFSSNYGFGLKVSEVVINPDGISTSTVDRGHLDIAYMVRGSACGGGPGDPFPLIHYEQVVSNSLTGSFPIVIGSGTTVGIVLTLTGYQGPPPFTGTQVCSITTTTFSDNITGNSIWPNPQPFLTTTYDVVSGIKDPNALFCCVTQGACCVSSPVIPHFLIPPTVPPATGQENSSTPVLNKAIYLSNYTFQFVNNFGRIKRQ